MATPNYGYEKRQKELAKKRKKEDKLKRKAEGKPEDDTEADASLNPTDGADTTGTADPGSFTGADGAGDGNNGGSGS